MALFTFASRSFNFKNANIKVTFLPTLGYVPQSCCFRAIANRALGMQIGKQSAYHNAIFGNYQKGHPAINYVSDIINLWLKKKLILIRDHDVFNINKSKLNALDRFLCSLLLLIDPRWYANISTEKEYQLSFNKLPFQQLMFIDKLITLLMRSDVAEYADIILMEMKQSLGITCLTLTDCQYLLHRFKKQVIAHIIPRRHGKTTFTNYLTAMCLVLFPCANLKMLYVAQKLDLTSNAFKTTNAMLKDLTEAFNVKQRNSYEYRQKIHKNTKENSNIRCENDFYYFVSVSVEVHGYKISCSFSKRSNFLSYEQIPSHISRKNELSCIVYRDRNVSIFQFQSTERILSYNLLVNPVFHSQNVHN